MRTARALVLAALVCAVPVRAHADAAKAWAAAKAHLPASTEILIGINLTQLSKSMLFTMAFPLLIAKQPGLKDSLARVKTTCGIDPLKDLQGVVVGTDKDQKQGAMFLAVRGLDQPKIVACVEALSDGTKATVTRTGAITEVAVGADRAYLSWIGKDVLVLPLGFDDRAQLQTWLGGKKRLAKGAAGKLAGKVNTRAALWAVSTVPQELDGTQMQAGYGNLTATGGNLIADLHVVVLDAASAQATADKATKELHTLAAGPLLAANLKTMLQQVAVTAVSDEVVIKATFAERDLLALGSALLGG